VGGGGRNNSATILPEGVQRRPHGIVVLKIDRGAAAYISQIKYYNACVNCEKNGDNVWSDPRYYHFKQ
jgi:hypothetical protein